LPFFLSRGTGGGDSRDRRWLVTGYNASTVKPVGLDREGWGRMGGGRGGYLFVYLLVMMLNAWPGIAFFFLPHFLSFLPWPHFILGTFQVGTH
jgi:hypothetical protein